MYVLNIQSIYRIEINGFVPASQVAITIRYRWSRTDYPDRPEFSIHFRDNCMKSLEPFTAKYSRYVTEIMIDSDRVGVLIGVGKSSSLWN